VAGIRARKGCLVPDCPRPHKGLGYCNTHLACWKRTGNPIAQNKRPHIAFADGTAICHECNERKPLNQFAPAPRNRHGRKAVCNKCCYRRYKRGRDLRFRTWLDTLKLERGCADCGYREHAVALDFDHLPGVEKVMDIAQAIGRMSFERLQAEVAKCEVVCANCHRVRTMERRKEVMPSGRK
jgi:hypothetical protein